MDPFMENKEIYLEFIHEPPENLTEGQKQAIIVFLKRIRYNIDVAVRVKTMLSYRMIEVAKKTQRSTKMTMSLRRYVQHHRVNVTALRFYCYRFFARQFKRHCGGTDYQFEMFLSHFPSDFKFNNGDISLRTRHLSEITNKYKAIIRKPQYVFDEGLLPTNYEPPFTLTLVVDEEEGDRIAKHLFDNHLVVSMDLEGYNLGSAGAISLCTIASSHDHIYIFDIMKCPYFLENGVLRELLQSDRITKVTHGFSWDAANLYTQFKIRIRNVFDTQLAFYELERHYEDLRLRYDGQIESSGIRSLIQFPLLCGLYNVDQNNVAELMGSMHRQNPSMWFYRPLCPAMLHFTAENNHALLLLYHAINNHPYYRPNRADIFYQARKKTREIIYNLSKRWDWQMPIMPEPRTVVRNRKNNISNYIRYNASTMQDDISITERYHTLSKRDVRDKSSVLSQSYLIDRELSSLNTGSMISSELDSTHESYSFRKIDSLDSSTEPYINNPVTHPYINNPASSMESSCLLLLTIGFFFIILVKWYKFWKKRAISYQKKKLEEGLMKTRTALDTGMLPDP